MNLVYPNDEETLANFRNHRVPGSIVAHLANFGRFQLGTSLSGQIYVPPEGQNGCEAFEKDEQSKASLMKLFVIVDSLGCSLETKARNIQAMGGTMAIIADQADLEDSSDDESLPEIDDILYDGTGHTVHLPTVITSKLHGDKLIEMWNASRDSQSHVVLKVDLETSQQNKDKVIYELFYGSILDLSSDLLLDLYKYQHALQGQAQLIPRIKTFECRYCPEEVKMNQCINDGEFCFFVPEVLDLDSYNRLHAQSVLQENLRQRCLYEMTNEYTDLDDHVYLNYMYDVRADCLEGQGYGRISANCSRSVMQRLGIDWKLISSCVSYQSADKQHSSTYLFQEDREKLLEYGITLTPALVINSHPYLQALDGDSIFRHICQSYTIEKTPDICKEGYNLESELG